MPITQDRMIAITEEGLANRQALTRLRDEITSVLRAHRDDPLMAITIIEGTIATLHLPSADNLIAESVHWRYSSRANEKNRDRMRRRRGTIGQPANAPHSMFKPRPLAAADLINLDEEFEKWNRGE